MATITDTGIAQVAKLIAGITANPFNYVATGSGSGSESTSSTALGTENTLYGSARASVTPTSSAGVTTWDKIFNFSGGSVTVQEIGLFDASSNGNMFMRHVLTSPNTYVSGSSLEVIITNTTTRGP